jgi:hypothetical protein
MIFDSLVKDDCINFSDDSQDGSPPALKSRVHKAVSTVSTNTRSNNQKAKLSLSMSINDSFHSDKLNKLSQSFVSNLVPRARKFRVNKKKPNEISLKSFEVKVNLSAIKIQKRIRGYLARKHFRGMKRTASVPKLSKEFIQEGECFCLVVMKRFHSKELTFYCWNLTTQELYTPLIVDYGVYNPTNESSYWEKLFVNIDEGKLYFRDFWDQVNHDRRDYITDEEEQKYARNLQEFITRDKKYRKRYFRENRDMKVVGK